MTNLASLPVKSLSDELKSSSAFAGWFIPVISLNYAAGFLIVFHFYGRYGITGIDYVGAKYIHIGSLFSIACVIFLLTFYWIAVIRDQIRRTPDAWITASVYIAILTTIGTVVMLMTLYLVLTFADSKFPANNPWYLILDFEIPTFLLLVGLTADRETYKAREAATFKNAILDAILRVINLPINELERAKVYEASQEAVDRCVQKALLAPDRSAVRILLADGANEGIRGALGFSVAGDAAESKKAAKSSIDKSLTKIDLEKDRKRANNFRRFIAWTLLGLLLLQCYFAVVTISLLTFFRDMISENRVSLIFPMIMFVIACFAYRMFRRLQKAVSQTHQLNLVGSHIFIVGIFFYLAISNFSFSIYPYIPATKGGGSYVGATSVRLYFKERSRPTAPESQPGTVKAPSASNSLGDAILGKDLVTANDNNLLLIVEETSDAIYLVDRNDHATTDPKGKEVTGPEVWRQGVQLPRVYRVSRDLVANIEFLNK